MQYWGDAVLQRNPCQGTRKLGNLARYYGGMPVTSAGAERSFSVAGMILTDKRASQKPGTLSNSVFIKVNKTFFAEESVRK